MSDQHCPRPASFRVLPDDARFDGKRVDGQAVVTVMRGRFSHPLPLFSEIRNHSPDGFNWGYGGSGPAQLALALIMTVTGSKEITQNCYQDYKWEVIAGLRGDWTIFEHEIRDWIMDHMEKHPIPLLDEE